MRRRLKLIVPPALAAAALITALAWWLSPWRGAGPGLSIVDQGHTARSAAPAPVGAPADAGAPTETRRLEPGPRAAAATPGGDPPAVPGVRPAADLYLARTGDEATWDFGTFRKATEVPDAVDPDTAFTAFEYLASCISVPHTEREFEQTLERYQTLFERSRRPIREEAFEEIIDGVQSGYLRCHGLGDADLVAAALEWLQLAADLGHLRAQVEFYRHLPDLMQRAGGRLFREPAYLDLHRTKSQDYFARALQTGHPQAFRAFAEAILDDVLYEPDPIAAYAHLYAGDLAAGGALPEITGRMQQLEARLTAGDLRAARAWGRELCRRWCPRTPNP